MQRKFLAAAAAVAPLLGLAAGSAGAQVTISNSSTTPVATATANNGAPDDIVITGSVIPTASGTAVTINSNNSVTVQGSVGFSNVDNAIGVGLQGGFTGQLVNTGAINLNESYTAPTDTSDGLLYGAFAQGDNRIGIQVTGTTPFNGSITTTGSSTIQGNTSEAIDILAPITGSLLMTTVTPSATAGTVSTIASGTIVMTGDNTIGIYVAPTGGIGGDLKITSVSATGIGAQGVVVDGPVGGEVDISGAITATGYRTTTRQTNSAISKLYLAQQMEQGGSAVTIDANVGKGIIVSAPPFPIDTTTVNIDNDGDGVPDTLQGTGSVSSFGAAPAMVLGGTSGAMNVGLYVTGENSPQPAGQGGLYGLIIQGTVTGNGVFDPSTTPNLPGVVPATGLQIGGLGGSVTIAGGMFNSGSILAVSYQADATAIHIGSLATVPMVNNAGTISASSTQVSNVLPGATGAPAPVTVDALVIDPGATVDSIVNTNTISASLTGTSGVGGAVGAIIDKSGSVTSVSNTGNISALLNQTVVAAPMPAVGPAPVTAIDISLGTAPQTVTQSLSPLVGKAAPWNAGSSYAAGALVSEPNVVTDNNNNTLQTITSIYEASGAITPNTNPASNPTVWRVVATADPTITGDIYFGSGGSTLSVTAGTITSNVIDMGSGVNTLTVNGPAGTSVSGAVQLGAANTGVINLNLLGGALIDTNALAVKAGSINVGANGVLLVAADPVNNTNTDFKATGASSFANGAQVGMTFLSLQSAPSEVYTILQTTGGGTLTAGTLTGSGAAANNAPYLYVATPSYSPSKGEILVTVVQRTAAQLGFDKAEASALDAILAAVPANPAIEQTILAQTTQAGLKSVYDQLLPNQGQGIFEALDAAAEAVSSLTAARPDAGALAADQSSLWLQEVNQRIDRDGENTVGSGAKMLGLIGGWEIPDVFGGAVGVTASYFNAQEQDSGAPVEDQVVASFAELGAYYRYGHGPFTFDVRGAGGYGWFAELRRFVSTEVEDSAASHWGGAFFDGHVGVAYEQKVVGRYYVRPELSADYLALTESGHDETGGGPGFDLNIASRASSQASAQAILVLGAQYGTTAWLRPEFRFGYREVFAGQVGDTDASFAGGAPFILAADQETGGWATIGFSIKAGTPYSYIALEGDFDYRPGQGRYDIRVAGRSAF